MENIAGGMYRVEMLGRLQVRQDGRAVIPRFATQKTAALLAYLAYHRSGTHPREVLGEMLWPGSNRAAARDRLSTALSSLRHQLEPPGGPLAGSVIRADRFSVGLNPQAIRTDVAEFEAAITTVSLVSSATERAQVLERAVALYSGPLLPGFYEEWIVGEQERLSGLFFDATGALIAALEAAGDLSAALRHARHAVSVDRLREDGHQHLLRLLAASGRPGAALRQYRELERLLAEELGDEPSGALRALARQIEEQAGLAAPPRRVIAPSPAPPRASKQPPLPDTVTFLMSDIAGSTRQWERAGDAFKRALETHHALLRAEFTRFGGQEIKEAGDSFLVAFPVAKKALDCAVACQQALAGQAWGEEAGSLAAVRMALHTGDVEYKDGDYHGLVLHRASRILTAAHGGQILVAEPTAALVRRDLEEGVRLMDLGVYRLRDVPTPERLFQVEHPGRTQSQFPPLAAEAGYPANLPLQFTRFFGREREISALREMLLLPDVRLVTLSGTGGTGKTRLALEVAERLVEPFGGAVYFVPLADLSDPRRIADAVLDSLRVPRSPQREPLDQAVEALARQPSLLVLDNFEQLVEGGGAQIVQTLLSRAPALTCLVTSRQVLGLSIEREFTLSPLPTPSGGETPERLSLFESVQLFVDRAQQVKPDFQVTNRNAPAVAQLCSRLEGIPLALELAAARAQVLTPLQMLSQLDQRFGFLVSRKRDLSERHRTLRAAIDWSYRLLPPELQHFFCRLSVFRGGWTVEAAEEVCEEPLALDHLAQLRECSLVLSEEMETGAMRFRMLETLREYGEEHLTPQERSVLRQHHLDYFLTLVETPGWGGHGVEMDNLRGALEWSKSAGGDAARGGLRLASVLAGLWWYSGMLREGDSHLAALLARQETNTPDAVRATALGGRAWILVRLGRLREACSLYEESLHIHRLLEDRQGIAASLNTLADTLRMIGRHEESRTLQQESLALYKELGNPTGVSFAWRDLGDLAIRLGEFAEARRCLRESDAAIGETSGMTQLRLAEIALFEGDYDAAIRLGAAQLEARRGAPQRMGEALLIIGGAALYQGDLDRACSCCTEGLRRFHEIGSRLFLPRSFRLLAYVAIGEAGFERAARLLAAAEARSEALESPLPPCERGEHDRNVDGVRAALGEDAFAAAWEAGRALTWEQAVAYALQEGS